MVAYMRLRKLIAALMNIGRLPSPPVLLLAEGGQMLWNYELLFIWQMRWSDGIVELGAKCSWALQTLL